jgi:hypothetical protein
MQIDLHRYMDAWHHHSRMYLCEIYRSSRSWGRIFFKSLGLGEMAMHECCAVSLNVSREVDVHASIATGGVPCVIACVRASIALFALTLDFMFLYI